MGVGWGNARPGSGRCRLSPGAGRGSRAGSGISGPWAGGHARPPLTRRSTGGAAPAGAGFPAPAAADGSVPHGPAPPPPAARSAVPAAPAAPGPPLAAAAGHGAEPPREAGRGRAAGQTRGPAGRWTTALPPPSRSTVPRRGRPAWRARARAPAAPASCAPSSAARLRRPPLPAAEHSGARERRWYRTQERRKKSVGLIQRVAIEVRTGERMDRSSPSRKSGNSTLCQRAG